MATISLQRTTLNQEMRNLLIFDDHLAWREGMNLLPRGRTDFFLKDGMRKQAISKQRVDDLFENNT